jgi:ABC-type transport system involved in multi-copper enzyme maturation permease subunit
MLRSVPLVYRMQRFEIIAIGAISVALVALALLVARELEAVGYGACYLAESAPPTCEALGRRFYDLQSAHASPVASFMHLLPYAIGLFLGAPLIARELERGTARLAWSIAPSRIRWYAWRVVPVVLFGILLAFVAGFAVDRLVAARTPGIDLENSFDTFGDRGVLVAITAFVMLAGSIGLGTVIGRVLPTVIAALILGYFGILAVGHFHADYTAREAVIVSESELLPGDRYIDQLFKLPDGRLVNWMELEQIDPESMTSETGPTYPIVYKVIPAERYREVEAREALILGSIGVAMLAGAGVIVARRRPG